MNAACVKIDSSLTHAAPTDSWSQFAEATCADALAVLRVQDHVACELPVLDRPLRPLLAEDPDPHHLREVAGDDAETGRTQPMGRVGDPSLDRPGLLRRLNPALRGWCNYFRHGSSRTFGYVDHLAFWRIVGWLKKRHVGLNMHTLVRRHLPGWRIRDGGIEMFRPTTVAIERYRYRGAQIPTPWSTTGSHAPAA